MDKKNIIMLRQPSAKIRLKVYSLRERCDYVGYTNIRAEAETEDPENDDTDILPQHPVVSSEILIPECNNFDNRWED